MAFAIRKSSNGTEIGREDNLDKATERLQEIKEDCIVVGTETGQVFASLMFSKWRHRIVTINHYDDTVTILIQKNGKTKSETMELDICG